MKVLSSLCSFRRRFRFGVVILNICWVAGFIGGMVTAFYLREMLVPMVLGVLGQPAGLSGLLVASVLPCLFCAYGASLGELWVLPLTGGLKAFGFGFCGCGVSLACGQSGWLVRLMLLFSDSMIIVPLYLFSLRHICGRTSRVHRDIALLLLFAVAVCFVDYRMVSPFLCKLFF